MKLSIIYFDFWIKMFLQHSSFYRVTFCRWHFFSISALSLWLWVHSINVLNWFMPGINLHLRVVEVFAAVKTVINNVKHRRMNNFKNSNLMRIITESKLRYYVKLFSKSSKKISRDGLYSWICTWDLLNPNPDLK